MQKAIAEEDLLANIRTQGAHLGALLRTRLTGPDARAARYVFDIRGGAGWWAVEWEFSVPPAFAMDVQARALENGLVIMGFTGGSNLEGTKGNHNMLSPAYNVTKQEVETIVDIFAKSVEEVLMASGL